ncbi:MAG: hypothetical protein FD129_892, partial [bacterium]
MAEEENLPAAFHFSGKRRPDQAEALGIAIDKDIVDEERRTGIAEQAVDQ